MPPDSKHNHRTRAKLTADRSRDVACRRPQRPASRVCCSAARSGDRARCRVDARRPPGAIAEHDFLDACVRCGLCVRACPYDTLHLAAPGGPVPAGTP
jgi:ferredoxin